MEEDGKVIHPATGTPQGGIVSPVLANIYLHYALDLWVEKKVAVRCLGRCKIVRFADDFVCAFESHGEALKFEEALEGRLKKFGLEVAKEKTQTLKFTKNGGKENGRFDFLGFELSWGLSRKGNRIVKWRTSRKKLRASLKNFNEWVRRHRHWKRDKLLAKLKQKLNGYANYYAVAGNSRSVNDFYRQVIRSLFKWLNRRSQRRSWTWPSFNRLLKRVGLGSAPRVRRAGAIQLELGLNVVVV